MSGIIRLTIDDLNMQYKSINLYCISDNYSGNKKPLLWKCLICNYAFQASKNYIDKDFIRCKGCFNESQLNAAKEFADSRGGQCLLKTYNKSTDKIPFVCKRNHHFTIKYANAVNLGHWCPICSRSNNISEEICRAYFEALFGEEFKISHPKWLVNSNGRQLELDGYCEKLGIAFEHNGAFHYPNKIKETLPTQLNDLYKRESCLQNNVKLIVIERLFNKTPLNKLRGFIIEECVNKAISIPYPNAYIDFKNCYNDKVKDKTDYYLNLAISKGGNLLSDYMGESNEKLLWKCAMGHKWKQYPYVIKRGHWCPICSGQIKSKNICK